MNRSTARLSTRAAVLAALLLPAAALANPINNLHCDFDGDGYDDLVTGSPGEDVGSASAAGAVNVIYGTNSGLSAVGDQIFNQGASGVDEIAETDDAFGAALACGDFNADGYDDLVVGAPQEDVGRVKNAGAVQVIYGSPFGVWASGDEVWTQASAGMLDSAESGDRFGSAVAAGDLDGDGYDDLVIGVPGEDIGTIGNAGAIVVLYGAYGGLYATGNQFLHQDSAGVLDTAQSGDLFGSALSIADFDGDSYADLAIGLPGQDLIGPDPENPGSNITLSTVGAVHLLYGAASGLSTVGDQFWHTGVAGVTGEVEEYERFGTALAAGDFDNDGFADLAIGAPGESVGSAASAGAVNVLYGTAGGLSATDDQIWYQGLVQGGAEARDRFGEALVAGDFNGDGRDDLVVGAPGEGVVDKRGAGAIHLLLGANSGLTSTGNQIWYQDVAGMVYDSETGDSFGATLCAGDFDGDGRDDVAIGVPGESVGSTQGAGVSHVMYGAWGGLTTTGNEVWHQGTADIEGALEAYDRTGGALLSSGVYRMPYATGTDVRVSNDTWTHQPFGRIDMSGTGGNGTYVIVAAASGTIMALVDTNAEPTDNNNYLWIRHANGEWTKYSHIATDSATDRGLAVGDYVTAGTELGIESDVGQATGDHLHFEVAVPNDPNNALTSGGFILGDNRVPQICNVAGNLLIGGETYEASGC